MKLITINPETGKAKFEFIAGPLVLDFCNTINLGRSFTNERFKTYSDLVQWAELAGALEREQAERLHQWGRDHPNQAFTTLKAARRLRVRLHRIFTSIASQSTPLRSDLDDLNAALAEALPHLKIVPSGSDFSLTWEDTAAPDRMLWLVAQSAMHLLTEDDVEYVKQCSGDGCSWLFHDQTRNHSRRWCSMEHCGNRMKMRRHYRRHRQ